MKALSFKVLCFLFFLGTLGVSGAKAQRLRVNFKVSTPFVAGDTTFPAGDYKIRTAPGTNPNMLTLSNAEGTNSVFLKCTPIKGKEAEKTVVIFHRYDKTLYLNKIFRAHDTNGNLVPTGQSEAAEMKSGGEPKEESVSGTEQ